MFAIKQVKHLLPPGSLRTLYYATIHPHMSYGILAWGNANKGQISRVNLLHKRTIRIISRARYNSHTEPLFYNLRILNVFDLYEYELLQFMHKYVNHELPNSFSNIFNFNHDIQVAHSTRQSSLLYQERCDSNFVKRLPLYKFPIAWNCWVRIIPGGNYLSMSRFKKFVKKYMLARYAQNVKCNNPHCQDCHVYVNLYK